MAEHGQPPPTAKAGISPLAAAAGFLREYWLRFLAISAVVIVPCFWHPRIQAGDLPSHVYNAWLAQLIERGQAPDLWLARQWNNVLFDFALSGLGNLVGLRAAEKIVVPAAVLLFFWGAFALICAITRRIPWFLLPCLAMFAYGWTFSMGFMNYYISLGLAFFALAVLQRGRGWQRAPAAAFIPLIWLAHPLGLALLIGIGTYMLIAGRLPPRRQGYLFGASAALLVFQSLYLAGHPSVFWLAKPRYLFNGMDQLLLYGPQYWFASGLLVVSVLGFLLADLISRRNVQEALAAYSVPFQLYGIAFVAALLLPSLIVFSQDAAPASLLTQRLTSASAVFLCCLLGVMKPQKWHLAGFATIAALFFFFLYSDTAVLNHMENQAERYVRTIPPGQRLTATIWPFPGSRVLYMQHIVDRACIGQCFSYGNYEPSSGQFRVRARSDNPFVTASYKESDAIGKGEYVVQPRDLPMFQVYQCDLNLTTLCMRELAAGETNGRIGVHRAR